MSRLLFWGGLASLAYSLLGFPLIVLIRGLLRGRAHDSAPISPRVSIVISARNEEAAIAAKLDSLLALDYPAECREVLVASDGSEDATNRIVAEFGDRGVRLIALDRVGKAAALNAAVAHATGEILVFTDANSLFATGSLRALVAPFADAEVGGVAGDQRYLDGGSAVGERSYWNLDRMLKAAESRAGHVISATGAIYAIRRELFDEVPAAVTDDFYVSTGVIQRGRRLVFAADAVAHEPVAESPGIEFGRKVRIITRGLRAVLARRALLDPRRHGFYSLQLLSHKVLRRLMAVPLLAVAVGSAGLRHQSGFYRAAGLVQIGFYGAASIGLVAHGSRIGRLRPFALPAFFCMVNAAGLAAALNVLRGRRIERWEPARQQRGGETEARITAEDLQRIADGLRRHRGDPGRPPDLSIVVPVNASGDEENVLRLLSDLVRYRGSHTFEVVLVVNNFPDGDPPQAIEAYRDLGAVVGAEPSLRRPGYAVALLGRMLGMRLAASEVVLHFDADCRIPDATALIDWYAAQLKRAGCAYTRVDFHDLDPHPSLRVRRWIHHATRWTKRRVLGIPTTRGGNYAVRRAAMQSLFDRGFIADEMNVGPAMKRAGLPVAYAGAPQLVVLTSARMFRPGWGRILSYLRFRLGYNLRVVPVRHDAARHSGRRDPMRRYVGNRPVS